MQDEKNRQLFVGVREQQIPCNKSYDCKIMTLHSYLYSTALSINNLPILMTRVLFCMIQINRGQWRHHQPPMRRRRQRRRRWQRRIVSDNFCADLIFRSFIFAAYFFLRFFANAAASIQESARHATTYFCRRLLLFPPRKKKKSKFHLLPFFPFSFSTSVQCYLLLLTF